MLHRRADAGVDDGGGGALVLELAGQDVDREGDEGIGKHLAQNLAGTLLVGCVGVGVQVADCDRLDAGGAGDGRRAGHCNRSLNSLALIPMIRSRFVREVSPRTN